MSSLELTYPGFVSAFLKPVNTKIVTLTSALHIPEVSHKHCFTVKETSNALLSQEPHYPEVVQSRGGRGP